MSYLGLRLGTLCEVSQLPCSQWPRLHGLTSSDLELRTQDPCEPGLSTPDIGLGLAGGLLGTNQHTQLHMCMDVYID
jgi:hypothetical protein